MSFLAWIDFDQADRDRTRRIMDLFDNEDTRDELGLGSVRDALSDIMFPGTSTIQTRLRYMLFVPWIYRLAGQYSGTVTARREMARALEIRLIDALVRGGEQTGVIGSAARERLKRLPSDVYWAGLLTLGIRRFQGSRDACLEASSGDADRLWAAGLPDAPDGFLVDPDFTTTFSLTEEEAGFLRDRLIASAPESIFAQLSRSRDPGECQVIWKHPRARTWPENRREVVHHAEIFSSLMHGASLMYNLMLSEKATSMQGDENSVWQTRATDYHANLSSWQTDAPLAYFEAWDLQALWNHAGDTTHRVSRRTKQFVETWRDLVIRCNGDIAADASARQLIREREMLLKGIKSRFRNDGALSRWSGASGTAPLNYRWPIVSSHLKDLAHA
jgi:hypothetical protein